MSNPSASSLVVGRVTATSLFLLLAAALSASAAEKHASVADQIATEVRHVFDERKDAVVKVVSEDKHGILCGSGFFADPSGTIYTHAGIVFKADQISVIQGDRKLPARLLVADPRSGIALIKVDAASQFIPLGNSADLGIASPVVAIGFPEDLAISPSFGLVGGFDRRLQGRYFPTTRIRANLPAQAGQGGAPLLNMKGEVVGILIDSPDNGATCYALPIEAAEKIRRDYVRFGDARHGWVGVNVEESALPVEGSRARISRLDPDTPAAASGLLAGDVILQIGSVKVGSAEDILDASFFLTAGDQTDITVLREGKKLDIMIKPTLHPLTPQNELRVKALEESSKIRLIGQPGE